MAPGKYKRIIFLTILGFALYYGFREFYFRPIFAYLNELSRLRGLTYFLTYLLMGLPIFMAVLLMHPAQHFFESQGIRANLFKGLLIGLTASLPMLIGYALAFDFDTGLTFDHIIISTVCAALFEELYFRGFLFGQIYRFSSFGFIPAILIGAVLFAIGHLYQSSAPATLIGIFITTFLGAILFAWAYIEWNNNLWVPIFLHLFMNLSWELFDVDDNALGGWYANACRIATITLFIVGTVRYKRRRGLPLAINRSTIWMKTTEA